MAIASAQLAQSQLCLLHNTHFVYKDICFTQCCLCNL